jgi:hypothetical protein
MCSSRRDPSTPVLNFILYFTASKAGFPPPSEETS